MTSVVEQVEIARAELIDACKEFVSMHADIIEDSEQQHLLLPLRHKDAGLTVFSYTLKHVMNSLGGKLKNPDRFWDMLDAITFWRDANQALDQESCKSLLYSAKTAISFALKK